MRLCRGPPGGAFFFFARKCGKLLTDEKGHGIIIIAAKMRAYMRGCSSMVEPQPSKLVVWVRFPSSAPRGWGNRTREGLTVKKTSRWDVFREERRDGPHTLACGSSSQQRFAETLVDSHHPLQGLHPRQFASYAMEWIAAKRLVCKAFRAMLPVPYTSPAA